MRALMLVMGFSLCCQGQVNIANSYYVFDKNEKRHLQLDKDLSDQFVFPRKRQIGGTCHLYASAALIEAAHHRAFLKTIDLPVSLYVIHYLQKKLQKIQSFPSSTANTLFQPNRLLGSLDGEVNVLHSIASVFDSIEHLGLVSDYVEKKILNSFMDELLAIKRHGLEPLDMYQKLQKSFFSNASLPKTTHNSMWFQIRNLFNKHIGQMEQIKSNMSKGQCANVYMHQHPFDLKLSLALLDKNIPFICRSRMINIKEQKDWHATVIMGYLIKQNDQIHFLHLDPNHFYSGLQTLTLDKACDYIFYLTVNNEDRFIQNKYSSRSVNKNIAYVLAN